MTGLRAATVPETAPPGLAPLNRDPVDPIYAAQWQFDLPGTHRQPLDEAGRPKAHGDYLKSHDALVNPVAPGEDARWRRRHNYYLNCLRDVDRKFARKFGTNSYPETFVVDRDGKITALRRGPVDQAWLDQNVEPLL